MCQNNFPIISQTADGSKLQPVAGIRKGTSPGNMKNTSLLLLTVWAVSGAYISMLLTGVATFTNKWVYTTEVSTQDFPNATLKLTVSEYSGLLEACRVSGEYNNDVGKTMTFAFFRKYRFVLSRQRLHVHTILDISRKIADKD